MIGTAPLAPRPNSTYQGDTDRPQTVLESVATRLGAQGADLLTIEARLHGLRIRAYGSDPRAEEGKPLPAPDGFAYALGQQLDLNQSVIDRISLLLTELEAFA